MKSTPNILYLHTHDCGRFISPYGYDMPTPNLMRFAQEGTVFRNACCASPSCSPSRAALLTGQYGHVNGMMGLAWALDGYEINDLSHHIVSFLKDNGYLCALSGRHHVSRESKTKVGYDRVIDMQQRGTLPQEVDEGVTPELQTGEAVRNFLLENHEKPFFLSVGFDAPHRVGQGGPTFSHTAEEVSEEDDRSKYTRPFPIFPDNPASRAEMANFQEGTRDMDAKFAEVLEALDQSEYAENTIVIMTTDHGAGMASMKCTLTEWGIGVFLMMRGPGVPQGAVLESLVSHVDLFPTIADLIGAEKPDWLQGTSLVPLLEGKQDEVNDYIYAEQGYHGCYRPLRAVRDQRFKLVRCFKTDRGEDYYSSDKGAMFDYWMEHGLEDRPVPEYALYDLMFDPMERCNQAENPAYAEPFQRLKGQLETYMRETNDPLLHGPLEPSPERKKAGDSSIPQNQMNTAPEAFELSPDGFPLQREWRAYWIQPPEEMQNSQKSENPKERYLFREEFFIAAIDGLTLFISAGGFYELYINGERVSKTAPNSQSDRKVYDEIDVTPYLKSGDNCFAISLQSHSDAPLALLLELVDSEGELALWSDMEWRTSKRTEGDRENAGRDFLKEAPAGIPGAHLQAEEWQRVGFDDLDWSEAVCISNSDKLSLCRKVIHDIG